LFLTPRKNLRGISEKNMLLGWCGMTEPKKMGINVEFFVVHEDNESITETDMEIFLDEFIELVEKHKWLTGGGMNLMDANAEVATTVTDNKMTAEQLLTAMDKMENGERIKLLMALSEKHFGRRHTIEEITKLNYEAMYGDDEDRSIVEVTTNNETDQIITLEKGVQKVLQAMNGMEDEEKIKLLNIFSREHYGEKPPKNLLDKYFDAVTEDPRMSADDIFKDFKTMNNGERIDLLSILFHKHFDYR
jgi:hypothetical protein